MKWLKMVLVSCVVVAGCGKPDPLSEKEEKYKIYDAFKAYYAAIAQHDYGRYESVVLNPKREEEFNECVSKIKRRKLVGEPIYQITLGLHDGDATVKGVSPWTSRDSEFHIRKVGIEFKIVE